MLWNKVDAKYIMGDKMPESWMNWSKRCVEGDIPGFDFSGVVVAMGNGLENEVDHLYDSYNKQ